MVTQRCAGFCGGEWYVGRVYGGVGGVQRLQNEGTEGKENYLHVLMVVVGV